MQPIESVFPRRRPPKVPTSSTRPPRDCPRQWLTVRRVRRLAGCVVLALVAVSVWRCSPVALPTLRTAPSSSGEAELTVLTYNVNFGMAGDGPTLDAILNADADILVLQETTAEWRAALSARLEARFPHQMWLPPRNGLAAGGAAVLSRWPLRDTKTSSSATGWFDALSAVVETSNGPVHMVALHLEPVGTLGALRTISAHHRREVEAHVRRLGIDASSPTIVVGDFNEERGGALHYLERRGFEDAVDRFAPGRPTWRWPIGSHTLRLQLDHVLHSEAFAVVRTDVLDEGRSDHLPVRVELRLRGPDER